MPIIFLHSQHGAWLRVYSESSVEIPHDSGKLDDHVREVHEIATGLLNEINRRLETNFTPATLEIHYGNRDDFEALRGVIEKPKD